MAAKKTRTQSGCWELKPPTIPLVIAQLVERRTVGPSDVLSVRFPHVTGSIPVREMYLASQDIRALLVACKQPAREMFAPLAQLVVRVAVNRKVVGSNPAWSVI